MIRRLLLLGTLGVLLQGCYMVPLAFIGPATSGFTTASLIQSGVTTGASYVVQKATGKTIAEHTFAALERDVLINAFTAEKITKKFLPK
tara:strand:- start:6603 stop:6869 length:267 start_codon:yes stop_codon:yes gene_type:complete